MEYIYPTTKSGRLTVLIINTYGLIILVFIGQGFSDAIFNDFAQKFPNEVLEKESYLFFMTLFFFASISGILILSGKLIISNNTFTIKKSVLGNYLWYSQFLFFSILFKSFK